jgi:oligosaccharide 4-alpha-D-glucosyltransferase
MKKFISFSILILSIFVASAQLLSINPTNATTNSDVTITYNAALGNAQLKDYTGDVYAYTGVITTESQGNGDWKHVRNGWGEVNPNTLMTPLGNNLFEISFNIRDFYELESDEIPVRLAFLFHNPNYTLVGRTSEGGDIFIEVNKEYPGNYISHSMLGEKLEINAEGGIFELQFYTHSIVKVEFLPSGLSVDDTSYTVIAKPISINPNLIETEETLVFSSSELDVTINKNPLRISYATGGSQLLSESSGFSVNAVGGSVTFSSIGLEYFYGGGSRAIPINRYGKKLRIYNEAHYGYGNNTPTLNISIPFITSNKGFGLFFDNRYPSTIDLNSSGNQSIEYIAEGGRLRYFFIAGDGYDDILECYTHLTGRQKLPPLWSLGYIQSKFGYQNENEARSIVNKIKQAGFPLDALILDLYWFGNTNDMGNLDWDRSKWQQPQQMMSDFSDKGVKTILITEPYFTLNSVNYQPLASNGYFAKDSDGDPFVLWGFWAGDAALLDLTIPAAQDWMWNFYQARREEGVSGWWCDLGEPENHPWEMQHQAGSAKSVHNVYSLIWARFIDENYANHYPNERLFNLIRSGYAGMQRYSTFPWSGDIQRSFDGLKAQIPIMLGAGISGLGYMHSDVGGFTGNDNDSELFTRWVQFGVFAPILRLHGVGTTEPVNFPDPYKSIMREYIKWRYKLLPYNYTLAFENTQSGIPLARQLNFYEPQNTTLANINDSYLWGKDLLVAPILNRNVSQRSVKFPQGKWINYHSLDEYQGGQTYSVSCNINNIPLFIRAGSFIANANPMESTEHYTTDSLVIQYFPDVEVPESYGYVFSDDGKSTTSISAGQFELLHFNGTYLDDEITIELSKTGSYANAPPIRNMVFEVYRLGANPQAVLVDNAPITEVNGLDGFLNVNPAYYWNSSSNILYINCSWDGAVKSISITKGLVNSIVTDDRKVDDFLLHDPWPNPFNDVLNLTMDVITPSRYNITLHNTNGLAVANFSKSFDQPGRESFSLNLPSHLPKGVYVLTVRGEMGVETKRVIKF